MPTKKLTIDPGPLATPEQAARAIAEADELLQRLDKLNLSGAVKSLQATPPSWEAVGMLAVYAHAVMKRRESSKGGSAPKKPGVTAELILLFKAQYEAKRSGDWGWQTAAAKHFDVEARTIRRKLLGTKRLRPF